MVQYVVAGLVLGSIYAISAGGLVVTYQSAGVLNFAFGSLAFFVARCYYFLHSQHHWAIAPAGVMSIVVVGPLLGVLLYVVLFRSLQLSSALVKVVATLGLSVIVPAVAAIAFGNETILKAPGLAPEPVRVFQFLGVPITADQLIAYGCVVAVTVAGAAILRYTDVGLRVRSMVDSPAMTSLSGTNPDRTAMAVWAVSTGLAGLVGVLSAPIIGLDPGDFTLLMVAAFAAVIAGRLRSLPTAVGVGLAMGIAGALVQYGLPPTSSLTAAVIPSIPFIFTAAFLVWFVARGVGVDEERGVGGFLDRAVAPHRASPSAAAEVAPGPEAPSHAGAAAMTCFALVWLLPLLLQGFWLGLLAQGVSYGIIFLSFTLVIGEGRMIWLCMATFAGIGGLVTAQLTTGLGWPVLAAVVAGALCAVPFGAVIGLLTIRMGNLYVALVTLIFGLLMENLVFSRNVFLNLGIGVAVSPPDWAGSTRVLAFLTLGIFTAVAAIVVNLRRSTTGLALSAVRWSDAGSRTIGISVVQMKVLIAVVAAFVAGLGGAVLALTLGTALPANYATLQGVFWMVALVTLGIRSNLAALFAGLAFSLFPGIALVYLPNGFGNVLPLVFGLGAIRVARYPDGWLVTRARRLYFASAKASRLGLRALRPGPTGARSLWGRSFRHHLHQEHAPPGGPGPTPR